MDDSRKGVFCKNCVKRIQGGDEVVDVRGDGQGGWSGIFVENVNFVTIIQSRYKCLSCMSARFSHHGFVGAPKDDAPPMSSNLFLDPGTRRSRPSALMGENPVFFNGSWCCGTRCASLSPFNPPLFTVGRGEGSAGRRRT